MFVNLYFKPDLCRKNSPMKRRHWPIVIVLLLFAVFFIMRRAGEDPYELKGMDRDPSHLVYSKHARCRMDCRQISEEEIKAILVEGKENYNKSEPRAKPNPRFALEGVTTDGQHLRVIFAPDHGKVVVVTAIDLEREWPCECD